MIAVDTNVLVYAHRAETAQHSAAARRLVELAEGTGLWGLPVFCAGEFIRVVTHRRVFNPPSTLDEAIQFLERVVAAPACHILWPESGFFELLTAIARQADARGNLAFDAQIAALCRQHGVSVLLTNDRDFARFEGLRLRFLDSADE